MKKFTFRVVMLVLGILNYIIWHMTVISKYGYNPLTVLPILIYILIMLV